MEAIILDKRSEGSAICYLCKISLDAYIENLPSTYKDYEIQREIVSNVYLDHLVDTVLEGRHIPTIVLLAESIQGKDRKNFIKIDSFKILDGLQRTYRLKSIWNAAQYGIKNLHENEDYLSWSRFKFSRSFSEDLRELDSNTEVFREIVKVFQEHGRQSLSEIFRNQPQWFEVWTGLSPTEEVRKMLTLNAGHKPVKARHQLELLFLNLLPVLQQSTRQQFKLVREREISSTQFSKNREPGTFHFAHLVTSLISFLEGKPVAPSTNLIQELQREEFSIDLPSALGDFEFIKSLIDFLVELDFLISDQYKKEGILWMGREVSLAGLLGALGAASRKANENPAVTFDKFLRIIKLHPRILNLSEFESERNNLDLSKVNIGNVNRLAVFSAVGQILNSEKVTQVNWKSHFSTDKK